MNATSAAVRIVAGLGLALIVAALVYAISSGRLFLFPFLLLIGFPMAAIFRPRRPLPPENGPPPPPSSSSPPRISLN